MHTASNYIADVRSRARNNWNGASGNAGNFRNAYGSSSNLSNLPGRQTNRPSGWSAQGGGNAMPASPKYIIQISNSSNANFTGGFKVFGASNALFGNYDGGTWDVNGNYTKNGITISCVYGTVNYQTVLTSSMANQFTVGGVYLETITGVNGQVSQIYTLTSQDAGGELYQKPIKPYIDPNQFQPNITYNNASFNMDALTSMSWQTIYASTVFQVSIFPSNIINPTQALSQGGQVLGNYGQPKVIGNLK